MSGRKAKKAAGAANAASRREALRAKQLAEAKQKRNMRIAAIVAGILAVAIIAVVTVVIVQDQAAKNRAKQQQAAVQITPPNALPDNTGILVNPGKFNEGVPTLTVYQDYQCSACKAADGVFGATINKLATDGKIKLEYRTLKFLDANYRNTASTQAAIGAACADVSGKYTAYHDALFKIQDGEVALHGFNDSVLSQTIPSQIGIEGDALTKFQSCFNEKKTAAFVAGTDEAASKEGVNTTPTYKVNGKNPKIELNGQQTDWWRGLDGNEESWMQKITEIAQS